MTGDPRQVSPIVPTTSATLVDDGRCVCKDNFSAQRKQSLLHRAEANRAAAIIRTEIVRSFGDIVGRPLAKFW